MAYLLGLIRSKLGDDREYKEHYFGGNQQFWHLFTAFPRRKVVHKIVDIITVVTHHRLHLRLFVILFFEGSLLNEYTILCIGYIFVIRFLCQFLSHRPSMMQKKNSQPPFSSAWIANVFLVSEPPACARKSAEHQRRTQDFVLEGA